MTTPPFKGNAPPLKLVPLTNYFPNHWIGRPVFAPCEYSAAGVCWSDYDEDDVPGNPPETRYDVGVVYRVEPADQPNFYQVYFIGSCGSSLHYSAYSLFTTEI